MVPGWIPTRESNRRRHHRTFQASDDRMTLDTIETELASDVNQVSQVFFFAHDH
jgi:hypothetical protein